MAAVHKIQGPYRIMNEHVQDEPNRLLKRCRSLEQAPSASVEAASARPQLRPRAAALVQRLQAKRSRLALPMALEGSEWGGPQAKQGPHAQRRESRPEPQPPAAFQQSGAPSTGVATAVEPSGRAAHQPLGEHHHGCGTVVGRGRAEGGPSSNRATASLSGSGPVGRASSPLFDARPPSAAPVRVGDGRGLPARATTAVPGRGREAGALNGSPRDAEEQRGRDAARQREQRVRDAARQTLQAAEALLQKLQAAKTRAAQAKT